MFFLLGKMLLILLFVTLVVGKPNIILIVTDDQDVTLGGLVPMDKTMKFARESGVIFENAFVPSPICCPARVSLLSGLYPSSHGVVNNSKSGGCDAGVYFMPTDLVSEDYRTFYAGKYLNAYDGRNLPHPSLDHWAALLGNSAYYNYKLNINGRVTDFGNKEEDYLTDVLTKMALEFIGNSTEKPFMMIIAPPAPHGPFTPSNKYKGRFSSLYAPRTPNFNTGSTNKHWLIRNNRILDAKAIKRVDEVFQRRWETLLSVDDMVAAVKDASPLDTYIFVTSDHGFHMGQFSQAYDKRQPYESDIRVPLIVIGPKLAAGARIQNPVVSIDIFPTMLDLAGVPAEKRPRIDGYSFYNLLFKPAPMTGRKILIQYWGEGGWGGSCSDDPNVKLCYTDFSCNCFDARNNTFSCVRSIFSYENRLECTFEEGKRFKEIYDLSNDPFQLNNLAAN